MYSYTLWVNLAETPEEIDDGNLAVKIDQLRELIEVEMPRLSVEAINPANYLWIFQCSAAHNRRLDRHERLLNVINWINEHLPGSYGLVYWRDDEDHDKNNKLIYSPIHANMFRVLVIARGTVTERLDPFLSPIVPTAEDP